MIKKRFLLVLLTLLAFAGANAAQAAEAVGKFTRVEGIVDALRSGAMPAAAVKTGDPVFQGDVVRTKSNARAEILFNDRNVLKIAQRSRIDISEYAQGDTGQRTIKHTRGLVGAEVPKENTDRIKTSGGAYKFEIRTNTAVAGVRGTTYFSYVSPDGISHFTTISGTVYITSGGVTIELPAGFTVDIRPDGRPSEPRPLTDTEKRQMMNQVSGTTGLTGQQAQASGEYTNPQFITETPGTQVDIVMPPPITETQGGMLVQQAGTSTTPVAASLNMVTTGLDSAGNYFLYVDKSGATGILINKMAPSAFNISDPTTYTLVMIDPATAGMIGPSYMSTFFSSPPPAQSVIDSTWSSIAKTYSFGGVPPVGYGGYGGYYGGSFVDAFGFTSGDIRATSFSGSALAMNDFGTFKAAAGGTYLNPNDLNTWQVSMSPTYSQVSTLAMWPEIFGTAWANGTLSGTLYGSFADISSGASAGTGVMAGKLSGTYSPTAGTWQAAQEGVLMSTYRLIPMLGTAEGRLTLDQLGIPSVEVGRTTLTGNLLNTARQWPYPAIGTLTMKDVTFLLPPGGSPPGIWATNGVAGTWSQAPRPGSDYAYLTGANGLYAYVYIQKFNNPAGTWLADVSGGGRYTTAGSPLFNQMLSWGGLAAGSLTGTTSGTFTGDAAGMFKIEMGAARSSR